MAELHFKRTGETLTVTFAEQQSSIPWAEVAINEQTAQRIYDDAGAYGRILFEQVTRDEGLRSALLALPANERLALHINDPEVALIPWEYLRTPNDLLLAARLNMVRFVEGSQRPLPDTRQALSIVAVPVSPVDEIHPLDTEREWRRLTEAVSAPKKALSLLRVRPPTLAQLEQTLPGDGLSIVHFMGHSGIVGGKSILEFEDLLGRSQPIDASYFADALDEHVFLVILNSCLSAVAIPTEFGNIARAVVSQGVPYALGMQFVLLDEAALEISKTLYQHLLQGRSVEEAVRRVRRAAEQNTTLHHPQWIAGIPVLYTHLRESAPTIHLETGHGTISPDPAQLRETCDLTALPQALHFVGRSQEISDALEVLLKPAAHGFVLLHGLGGIGKTSLAYAIAERAGWSYRDRVLAISFETFATQEGEKPFVVSQTFADRFYNRLARFYGLDPSKYQEARDLQDAILQHRVRSRSLLVLDNMETLIETQKQGDPIAQSVATFLSRLQEGDGAILLTSRSEPPSDWGSSVTLPITGLSNEASADLFLALLPADRRPSATDGKTRQILAKRVQGHPLSVRLLAGRFAESTGDLMTFLDQIEEELKLAEQTTPSSLEDPERQRTLYACMDYSVKRLTTEQRKVLDTIILFQAPFLSEFATHLLNDEQQTPVHLQNLIRLGLLIIEVRTFKEGALKLLEIHSMLRWYIKYHLIKQETGVQERYGEVYEQLARRLFQNEGGFGQSSLVLYLMYQSLADCEMALKYLPPIGKSFLAFSLAELYKRRDQNQRALALFEQALEVNQELGNKVLVGQIYGMMADVLHQSGKLLEALEFYNLSLHTLLEELETAHIAQFAASMQHAMAGVLKDLGRPEEALALYQQALLTKQQLGDRREAAVTQKAIAEVLEDLGKPEEAFEICKQILQTCHELGDREGVIVTQHIMAYALQQLDKPEEALALYLQTLQICQESGYWQRAAMTQKKMADMFWQLGKPKEALTLYEQALMICRQLEDVRGAATMQKAMADMLWQLGKPEDALTLYEQALHAFQEVGDIQSESLTQYTMANVLVKEGKLEEALTFYEQALHFRQQLKDMSAVAMTQVGMAFVLTEQGKTLQATILYEQSLHILQELEDVRGIAEVQLRLSQLLFQQGEHNRVVSMVWGAYTNLNQHGYTQEAQNIRQYLKSLKKQLGAVQFDMLWEQMISDPQPDWLLNGDHSRVEAN